MHDIYLIWSKAMYLAIALNTAVQHMPLKTWAMCCEEAVSRVREFHQHLGENSTEGLVTKNGKTVQKWFCMWKRNSCCFMNPHFIRNGKSVLPHLLEKFPNWRAVLVKEMEDNLAQLSGEYVFTYLIEKRLPSSPSQQFTGGSISWVSNMKKGKSVTTWTITRLTQTKPTAVVF
mmetsp:Transcript_21026/g.24189  ORF Transcript_21026/g.24189 Transcript_21026/m.24189 type:complete len:174 (+) Transcript_21026:382-903(+)